MKYSLNETFNFLLKSSIKNSIIDLYEGCKLLGFTEEEYSYTGMESQLPEFDEVKQFSFETDNNKSVRLEMFGLNNEIIQVGVQIVYKEKIFSSYDKHVKKILSLAESYFGSGFTQPFNENITMIHFGYDKLIFFVTKTIMGNIKVLTFKFGNAKIWNSQ